MKRKDGYYWVKFRGEWMPAKYDCDYDVYPWQIVGADDLFEEKDFEVIDNNPLSPPK